MPFTTGRDTLNDVPTTKEVDWRLPPCLWQGSGQPHRLRPLKMPRAWGGCQTYWLLSMISWMMSRVHTCQYPSPNCNPITYKPYRWLRFLGCHVHSSITSLRVRLMVRQIELHAHKLLSGVDPFLFPLSALEVFEFELRMKNSSEKISNNNENNYNTYSWQSCTPLSHLSVNNSGWVFFLQVQELIESQGRWLGHLLWLSDNHWWCP